MDEIDLAQAKEEIGLSDAIRNARTGGPVAVATGRCLWCDDVTGEHRWCSPECRNLWCKAKGVK